MNVPLRAAVVGAGVAGKQHIHILNNLKNVHLAAICDLNKDTISKIAGKYDIPKYYTDFNEMLENENLDFINICTPPSSHAPLTIKAIERGVHVLCEKPFTVNTKEANDIIEAMKNNENIKVGVVHNVLFEKVIQDAINIYQRGEIGDLLNINIIENHPFERDIFITNKNYWGHKIPGGRVCEALPHQIYLAQEFLNKVEVKSIQARKIHEVPWISFDEVKISLESDSAFGSIYWSRNASKEEYSLHLIGTEGTLKTDLITQTIVKIRYTKSKYKNVLYTLGKIRQLLSSMIINQGKYHLHKYGVKKAYVTQHEACIRSFIDSIINNKEPVINAQKGLDCICTTEEICKHLEDIYQSHSN